jgi:PAS domain S-box-containing protein
MLNPNIERPCWNVVQQQETAIIDNKSDRSEESFRQLFVTSAIGMALLDIRGRFLFANQALCSALGYSEEELRKMRCEQLLNSVSLSKRADFLRSFDKAHTTSWQTEQILCRKDRSLMPARVWISSLQRASLEDSLSLMIVEDITEQKEAEHELDRRKIEVEMLASQLIQSQETERKRLARELHDDIGQRLSLVASEVALMASQQTDKKVIAPNRLDNLRDELDSLCSDLHGISHDLHSYKLQHLGLKLALKDLCRRLTQSSFRIDLDVDDMDEPTSKEVSLCMYRVVQEALNNALRHAHTLVAAVTITKVQNMFYMTIQDTGVGFERGVSRQGLGLISMTERLKLVKGELKLNSILGHGTEIWVSIPDEKEGFGPAAEGHADPDLGHSVSRCEVA